MRKLLALLAVAGMMGWIPAQAAEEETPLGKEMETVSGALKSLRKLAKTEARWTASAAKMREAEAACIKAMELLPATITEMPEGVGKTKAAADFKRMMGLSLAALCELEVAFINEDEAAVEKIIDKVKDLKKAGHEKYVEEEE